VSAHTLGEWQAHGRGIFAGDVQVGTASHPRDKEEAPDQKFPAEYDEAIANARLMAAAPDLLRALQEVVRISDRKHDAWDRARAAITKAGGAQQELGQ
jgi:hypothetical protein